MAAAREFKKAGAEAVVFERADRVGGRARTLRLNNCVVDTGVQTYTPRGMALEQVMLHELPTDGLVLIARRVDLYLGGRAMPGSTEKNRVPRYIYKSGADELPRLLAEGLDARLNTGIEALERRNSNLVAAGEEFDFLVLSPPFSEVMRLLATIGDVRNLYNASYRPCLSLVLNYRQPQPDVPYYALLAKQRITPVLWIGIESLKAPERAPEGECVFVVQFGPEYSRAHLHSPEETISAVATAAITRLFGKDFDAPAWTHLERWAVSQPERVALFDSVNRDARRIVICGDGTLAGRAENAFESGVMAARKVLELAK